MCKIIYSDKYSLYNLGDEHPFSPIRLEMTLDLLNALEVNLDILTPEAVTSDELETVHDSSYINTVENLSNGIEVSNFIDYGLGTQDNPIVKNMGLGARYQVGGTGVAANLLLTNKEKKVVQFGGGLHHAQKESASGFCIYNDLAFAIKKLTNAGWHVAYLDLDVHHGDGVQNIFNSDSEVMTISLHESGEFLYPGSGWVHEVGKGMGKGLKLNVPLEPFTEGESYLEGIKKVVEPALAWYKPDALIIQAGADTHFSDPLADLLLTTYDFEKVYKEVIAIADKHCNGRTLFTFGGGYSLTATPRIWALLVLIIQKLEIPENIPVEWKLKWEKKLNIKLPDKLQDILPAYNDVPRKEEITNINSDTYQHVMDAVSMDWF